MSKKRYSKYLPIAILLGDITILVTCFLVAYVYKFNKAFDTEDIIYIQLLSYTIISWLLVVIVLKQLSVARYSDLLLLIRRIAGTVLIHSFCVFAYFVILKAYYLSREHILVFYVLFSVMMLSYRVLVTILLQQYRKRGYNIQKVIIAGYGEISEELKQIFLLNPELGYKFHGFFDDNIEQKNILGSVDDIEEYISHSPIDEIFCCLPYVDYNKIKNIIDFAEDKLIKISLIADFRGFSFKNIELKKLDHIPILNITSIPLDNIRNRILKRIFDIIFSLGIIILLLSWVYPIIAILIRLESKGGTLFKQQRTGINNNPFTCYKFRTMRVNKYSDQKQAERNDPRITKIGFFLRRTSLDELLQFLNVLKGEMSVVGPRPHMLKHTEDYSKKVKKFLIRHKVKPGITGLAQIRGLRGETKELIAMKNRVKLDRLYIEDWSLLLDIKIIFATFISVLKGDERAY